jgi:hypothetical protein
LGGREARKEALLFVNKKKQKNFIRFSAGMFDGRAKRSESFLVLFFKKELLAFYFFLRPTGNSKRRFYPQISQINADFGASSVCVDLRIDNCINRARTVDAEHKSWMPAFAGMTGWRGWGQRWIASLRSQ